MKFLVLLFCIAMIFNNPTAGKVFDVLLDDCNKCKESLNVENEILDKYYDTIVPDEEPHSCFAHCVLNKLNLFTDDGSGPNFELFSKMFSPTIYKNFKLCFDEITERSMKCEWAYEVFKCIRKNS
uniref:Putative pbp/gobp family n=1 Tax=Corethrella appendiculata TaxID=1370023 RepID=U5ER84_9DIPT